MKRTKLLNSIFGKFGYLLIRQKKFDDLISQIEQLRELLRNSSESRSQLFQDIFVLAETGNKVNGYFVEFGATNGVELSNTFLLEKKYGWRGILAEPARCWARELQKYRSSIIDFRCVFSKSGENIEFNETQPPEISTIDQFSSRADGHSKSRLSGKRYSVETVSLLDLLDQHNAPKVIDYLSIDTEGSELAILQSFDFSRYDIRIITCEHGYTPDREKIFELLTSKGYQRKFERISHFDDWYIKG